jgi:hypothetical protein
MKRKRLVKARRGSLSVNATSLTSVRGNVPARVPSERHSWYGSPLELLWESGLLQ